VPKPEPFSVSSWFWGAEFINTLFTAMFVIEGRTVKLTELLEALLTLTTTPTVPETIPVGTTATMDVPLHVVIEAVTPPKVTVLLPFVVPKFLPVIVIGSPDGPEVGDTLDMLGAANKAPCTAAMKRKIHERLSPARTIRRIHVLPH